MANQALTRMQEFTTQLWVAFGCSVLVAVAVGILSFFAPFLVIIATLAAAVANFLLLGALVSSIMVRHGAVVAEASESRPTERPSPMATEAMTAASVASAVPAKEAATAGEPSLGPQDGPLDFSGYSASEITIVTRRLKLLDAQQRAAWDRAGRPNLTAWGGTDFDGWIAGR